MSMVAGARQGKMLRHRRSESILGKLLELSPSQGPTWGSPMKYSRCALKGLRKTQKGLLRNCLVHLGLESPICLRGVSSERRAKSCRDPCPAVFAILSASSSSFHDFDSRLHWGYSGSLHGHLHYHPCLSLCVLAVG